jgi:LysR family glycine cleavage system transcriptional activator
MKHPYDLSSITALICFEAAARNVSFKAAAAELNVTPAAISHQIKALEADLGCLLFQRLHRGVELTEKGAFLLVALQRGLDGISSAVAHLRGRLDAVDVTIRTTTAVSALWLTPRVSAFWKIHPAITVSQIVSDLPDKTNRQDLSILYGRPQDDGCDWRPLFHDRIIAIGTPRFRSEHGIATAADLAQAPLIHMNNEDNDWTNWAGWFAELGHPPPRGRGLYVNNYMIALQAAQDDVGAVLGWDGLVGDMLADGRLVALVPDSVPSPVGFYLRVSPRATVRARLFADWLQGRR